MSKRSNLMAFGMAAQLADELGYEVSADVSAAGTVIGDATDLTNKVNIVTTCGSGAGVQLPDKWGKFYIENAGANAGVLYPHSATATINSGSAGAGITFTNAKAYEAIRSTNLDWRIIQLN